MAFMARQSPSHLTTAHGAGSQSGAQHPSCQQAALCMLCDLVEHGGPAAAPFAPLLKTTVTEYLAAADAAVRQACVYLLGQLSEHGGEALGAIARQLLPRLVAVITGTMPAWVAG